MVETITPVVYGRRSNYITSLILHTVAAATTAALTGALLGLAGRVSGAPWSSVGPIALVVVALVYALREAFRLPIPLPNARRQVPEWWRTYFSPPIAATLYGAGLGVAFLTFLGYGTFVAVAAGAVVSGDPLVGALLCAPFGVARGLSLAAAGRGSAGPGTAVAAVGAVGATTGPRLANAAVLGLVAAAAALQVI